VGESRVPHKGEDGLVVYRVHVRVKSSDISGSERDTKDGLLCVIRHEGYLRTQRVRLMRAREEESLALRRTILFDWGSCCVIALRNGSASKVVSYAHERRDGARDESVDALQCRRRGVRARVEQEGMVWFLGVSSRERVRTWE